MSEPGTQQFRLSMPGLAADQLGNGVRFRRISTNRSLSTISAPLGFHSSLNGRNLRQSRSQNSGAHWRTIAQRSGLCGARARNPARTRTLDCSLAAGKESSSHSPSIRKDCRQDIVVAGHSARSARIRGIKLRDLEHYRADVMSVFLKSSPLNKRGSEVILASA
jgi:hypothetical protein